MTAFRKLNLPLGALLVALLSSACSIELHRVPTGGKSDAGAGDGGPSGQSSNSGSRARCPNVLGDEPVGATKDIRGHFINDQWQEFSCDQALAQPTCGEYAGQDEIACEACFGAKELSRGVCGARFPGAGGECVVLYDIEHECGSCVAPIAKARACCLGLNVDCRPVVRPAKFGGPCGVNEDCEAGLVCVLKGGLPVCACPGDALAPFDCSDVEAIRRGGGTR